MGLLKDFSNEDVTYNNNSDSVYVKDCVGKQGYCEIVTSIEEYEMEKKQISGDINFDCDVVTRKNADCGEDCKCKQEETDSNADNSEELLATALNYIITRLDDIERKITLLSSKTKNKRM